MKRSGFRALVLAAVFGAAVLGCSDTTAPEAAAPRRADLLSSLLQVDLLQRLLPLAQSQSSAATIGPDGGVIRIPQAGVSITFPAGAVQAPVAVRVTALAGSNVAYTFEPHGLRFQNRPVITQELGVTQVLQRLLLARQLEGVYFANESQIAGGTATVQEAIPATVDLLRLRMSFPVSHFSGYAASTARRGGGYITSTGTRIGGGGVR